MLGKIKFLTPHGWGYAILEDPSLTGGKDVYLHAMQLKGSRFLDLQPGDDLYIEKLERDGLGFRAIGFRLHK